MKAQYIYILWISLLLLPHLICTVDYISCTHEFTKDSYGIMNLYIRGEVLTNLPSAEGKHNGMYLQLGSVLNNSMQGFPCDSLTFSPIEAFSGGCQQVPLNNSYWITPGVYIANFTSWNWTFTNILAFSNEPTIITCKLEPYQTIIDVIFINEIIIPGAIKCNYRYRYIYIYIL